MHSWSVGRIRRVCRTCKKEFYVQPNQIKRGEGKYCSRQCRFTGVRRNCVTCRKEFYIKNYRKNDPIRGKYCSKKCRDFRIKCRCIICEKEFIRSRIEVLKKGGRYCSFRCYIANSRSPLEKQIREMYRYRKWRKLVFERDEYTCIKCGTKGGYVEAHHNIAFGYLLKKHNIKTLDEARACEFLWDINNGRTLCVDCHRKTTNYGRLKNRISYEYMD